MRKKLDYDYCSASPILEWLGDKWALVVLLKLHENGVIRFNELYKTIPSISEKMLSDSLLIPLIHLSDLCHTKFYHAQATGIQAGCRQWYYTA